MQRSSARPPRGRRDEDPKVQLSKLLSKILRHRAQDFRIPIRSDGFVKLTDLFRHQSMRSYTPADVHEVVAECSKQRFALTTENGVEYIRAQQGHTITAVADEELLERVEESDALAFCYHGTYAKLVDAIKATGLNRMKRNHVHLTPALPGDDSVISGMRRSADVIVVVDMKAAMRDGIPFFRSGNNVILSPGFGDTGAIPAAYLVDFIYRREPHRPSERPAEVLDKGYPHYYCVIDFEATCLENAKIDNQEVIEFPALLVNAESMQTEAEFHSYVRPAHNPVLSEFCTRLTGIEQATVDVAPTFDVVYAQFRQFMAQNGFDIDSNWAERTEAHTSAAARKTVEFVSYGDFEYRSIFPDQCRLVGVEAPRTSRGWVNVKSLFSRNFKRARQRGMAGALEHLGLPLVGRHHSGIDDTRNICAILRELKRRGIKIEKTTR